jgi:hypothetical protein
VTGLGPILADPTLAMCADVLDDLESVRIANENRLRQLTDTSERGHGLGLDHPDVKRLAALVALLVDAEHQAELNLARVMRNHPLGAFVKARKGIGEKQAARLLAAIGDPYWNDLHDRPRTVRELFAFCGMNVIHTAQRVDDSQNDSGGVDAGGDITTHSRSDSHVRGGGGVAPRRRKGERVNWSPKARTKIWLIADKCVQITASPYREIYDKGRVQYADALHRDPCERCGPKGKPAQPGTPLSAGHQHARARRLIAKQILKDLWHAAKDIHAAQNGVDGQEELGGVEQTPE